MATDESDNSTLFSLDGIRRAISSRASLSQSAAVRSMDGSDAADIRRPFVFEQPDYDRTEAPKDEMRKFFRQFETTPIVRKPITSFASRVTEPGYFIESTMLTEQEATQLGNWLGQAAIMEGLPGRDFRLLAKKAIVQREVRGTSLIEIAPDREDDDKIAGLKLINPETMEAVTRPNQSILMAPEDNERYESAPLAESGGAAAWLQDVLETDQTHWGQPLKRDGDASNDTKIGFRRDEIIPLTRDADVGEVFGTSRIEAVSRRIDGIKQKLNDNDEAIASKAWPLYLFIFGNEENPWSSSEISQFMSAHEMENFHPGMKQGVRGDVSVETISGEVADIAEYLEFDIRWIMSSMPMPIFVLGAFESASVGQVSGIAQQQDVNRQIKEARRELEEEFTPVVRRVAMQQGIEEERAMDINLKFGKPGETDLDMDRNEQVIRYISGANGGEEAPGENTDQRNMQQRTGQTNPAQAPAEDTGDEGEDDEGIDASTPGIIQPGETPETVENPTPDIPIAGVDEDANPFVDIETNSNRSTEVWGSTRSVSELAANDGIRSELSELAQSVFQTSMTHTLDELEKRYSGAPQYAVAEFENIANRELNRAVREKELTTNAKSIFKDMVEEELSSFRDGGQIYQGQSISFYAQNFENAVRDATEEMLRRARVQTRHAVVNNEGFRSVRARIEKDYSDSYLQERANLIAHMETTDALESAKLNEFERQDGIIGFRISNEHPSTPVTRELAGVEVYFDDTEDLRETVESHLSSQPQKGFDPLPRVPPYHFGDTTTLEPLYE